MVHLGSMLYTKQLYAGEINVIENVWREKVNASIIKSRLMCATRLAFTLELPIDVCMKIYEFAQPSVPYICGVQHARIVTMHVPSHPEHHGVSSHTERLTDSILYTYDTIHHEVHR